MARVLAFALFLVLVAAPASAQRRGGGGRFVFRGPTVSVGARVGFHAGPHFSGRVFVGPRFFPNRTFVSVRRFYPRRFFYGYPGIYAYPIYGYPYYDNLGFGYSSYDSSNDYAAYQQNQQLSQQLYDLSSQVRDLRDQNDQLRYDLEQRRYRGDQPPQPGPTPQAQQSTPAREAPPTLLVFQDGRQIEARSYAVVGQTIWILSPQHAQKYQLSQLNVDETKRLNAERGLEFDIPAKK